MWRSTVAVLLQLAIHLAQHFAWSAASVPSCCVGWPHPNSAVINATNYSNADLPPLLEFLNGTAVDTAEVAPHATIVVPHLHSGMGCASG